MRFKEWGSVAALAVMGAAYFTAYTWAEAQADAKAASVLSEVRKALGGEQKLAGLKALSLRADYRREMGALPSGFGGGGMVVMMGGPAGRPGGPDGGQQQVGKIEIDLELPDRYLRSDVGSGGFSMTRTEGFEGTRPFMEVVPNSPGMRVQVDRPTADPARAQGMLRRHTAELARLFLGLTGGTQPGFAATYSYGGQAESPDGKADIIAVAGPDDFELRLFVDAGSHLPLMLTYMEAEPRILTRAMSRDAAGGRGNAGAPPELTPEQRAEIEKQRMEAAAAPPKMVEARLYFSDFRKVDGISLPHRIARGKGEKTIEEWDITTYKVNPAFKADRFKVGS
jgi:hypothetical protein